MRRTYEERISSPRQGLKMNLDLGAVREDFATVKSGAVILDLRNSVTGEQIAYWQKQNVVTLDAGILAARLFRNSLDPNAGENNGLRMLAVGTGATGNLLSPDAPHKGQRKLNNEIARKPFSSVVYRNANGHAVTYPTNVVDFTVTFGENEAVGALNEMGLICPYSSNPNVRNPIDNGPHNYDPTIDVTGKDLLANYLTFGTITKPAQAIMTWTWRLVF